MVGDVTLSQPARGKVPPKDDPTTNKTKLQLESPYIWHKWHPKRIKLRKSRKKHHQVPQVSYHRSSHEEHRESKQISLRNRNKQEEPPKMGRQRKKSKEREGEIPRSNAK